MLEDSQIEQLRLMLQTSGWRDVVMKLVKERKARLQEIGYMLPAERPKPYAGLPDDDVVKLIRGEVRACDWFMRHFENEVVVHDQNRERDELASPTV